MLRCQQCLVRLQLAAHHLVELRPDLPHALAQQLLHFTVLRRSICAHPAVHATAMAYTASYLTGQVEGREFGGGDFVRRAEPRARSGR